MKNRTLEIDEDLAFQGREWKWQGFGTVALFLFVGAAVLGLTGGGGLLSHGEAGERGGAIHGEYDRIVRRGAPATIRIRLRPQAAGDARLWVSAAYFERVKLETVTPQPDAISIEEQRHVYTFRSSASQLQVTFEVEHTSVGRLEAEAGLIGGPSIRFSQIALF